MNNIKEIWQNLESKLYSMSKPIRAFSAQIFDKINNWYVDEFSGTKFAKYMHNFRESCENWWAIFKLSFGINRNHIREKSVFCVIDVILVVATIIAVPKIYGSNSQSKAQNIHHEKEEVVDSIYENPTIHAKMPKTKKRYDFVHEFAQLDEDQKKQNQILPSVVIAQAGIESNWGHSQLYKLANNAFGMKGAYYGHSIELETKEYTSHHHPYYQQAEFKKYPNLATAVADHNHMLIHHFLNHNTDMNSYISIAQTLQQNNYATNPNYAHEIMQYIKQNNLDRFD